ncbi:Proteinaceous RNase P 1, chloroplastic/mitochondrial [Glycine max]|nr:Proteinaceous RNase P 1, chloroplastic/mitochondrial [Glycine max]
MSRDMHCREGFKCMRICVWIRWLRSYGPALSTFCNNGEIDKAFAVEKHMLNMVFTLKNLSWRLSPGIIVRKVSPTTGSLIFDLFKNKQASRVGKRKWDKRLIMEATENNGGGRHGQGWLGKGKWEVVHTTIGNDGLCKCCGVQLTTIDLDPVETQNFANLVASLAVMREKGSNFQKFQIDEIELGICEIINAVGNEICQTLPSKKFPLIILHNKRSKGDKMDEPINRSLIDKWNNADALYATPSGSNDNWYWLYAAIKFRCLLVTNDEMRDHLFQLLGNDFFPKWKERHQVRFSFSDTGSPVFHMPPPCSVVIQSERRWLCITRAKLDVLSKDSSTSIGKNNSILSDIEAAELIGDCTIDFHI